LYVSYPKAYHDRPSYRRYQIGVQQSADSMYDCLEIHRQKHILILAGRHSRGSYNHQSMLKSVDAVRSIVVSAAFVCRLHPYAGEVIKIF
jgi:hypothetical protein